MTYETYRYIFIGSAILAGVMLLVSLALFIVLHIPKVIGDLSGATARKAIEDIRNQNMNTGEKVHKTSKVNKERGRLTEKISPSGNLLKKSGNASAGAMATEKIGTEMLSSSGETTQLNLTGNETTVLEQPMEAVFFEVEYEITYLQSDEVIE